MVVVFGSINLDLVARVPRIPAAGETLAGESLAAVPGGKGANQALAARQAGADVAMYGAVGSDGFAAAALANLAAAGVDLAGVATVTGPTGVALINVDAHGENAITVVPGANAQACATAVPDVRLVRGTTLVLQLEVPVAGVVSLAVRAMARGARALLNAAPALPLPAAALAHLDLLIVNQHEAAACAAAWRLPDAPDAFAAAIRERFGVAAVITLGAAGALAVVDGAAVTVQPPPVAVVDTTGAGDAFVGALAAALDRGAGLAAALDAGVAAGAHACTYHGAQRATA